MRSTAGEASKLCTILDKLRFDTPIGPMGLQVCQNGVHSLDYLFSAFDADRCAEVVGKVRPEKKANSLHTDELCVFNWLRAYFEGQIDDLPKFFEHVRFCCFTGSVVSEFAVSVYKQLCAIPYGDTIHYSEIAAKIGHLKSARAVGGAVSRNPVSLMIPCHRVVPKSGDIGKYSHGKLDQLKRTLLLFEARQSRKSIHF
uniref:Methylated-DNA--protein-cysteine methyltransferase n=1 Tax=Trichuris muris TaxID=70415 RepID=A0A5S6QW91_TRIMR